MVQVKERNFQEVRAKFESLVTDLTKMEYLESALKASDISMDVKKFAFTTLADLYGKKLMYEKAARAMYGKAGYDTTFREKIESYLKAGEFFAKGGNIISADDMFLRATREGNSEQQARVALTRKNIYLSVAAEQEKRFRMANAVKFYEHLLTFKLDDLEKSMIKKKLMDYYKKVGRFNDARAIEGK